MTEYLAFKTDQEIAEQLAKWVAQQRLEQNLTQQDVYQAAQIAKSTYKKFEQSGEISLRRFIASLRAVGRLDVIEQILNLQQILAPMDKLQGRVVKTRKRARHKRL